MMTDASIQYYYSVFGILLTIIVNLCIIGHLLLSEMSAIIIIDRRIVLLIFPAIRNVSNQ